MAESTVVKTRLIVEYFGEGGKSGGSYVNSNIKFTAPDGDLYLTASAINNLQAEMAKSIYKVVETELSE